MNTYYKSFAKLNLNLHVYPLEPNNLHPISSVFQEISLHDEFKIGIQKSAVPKLTLSCEGFQMPLDSTNILYKIFNKLRPYLSHSYTIHIHKHIPLGSGMGGSSSNAATFLKAINTLENLNWRTDKLINVSQEFGSDIAFFISGKAQHVSGFGTIINPVKTPIKETHYTIIYPNIHCSTKDIYTHFDVLIDQNKLANKTGVFEKNYLYEVVLDLYPKMKEIYNTLCNLCDQNIYLTGSGSTFFTTHDTHEQSIALSKKIKTKFSNFYIKSVSNV